MNGNQVNEFIEKHNVKKQLEKSFENLLKINPIKDLDITDKNIFVDTLEIKYKKSEFNFHSFSTPVKNIQKIIGSFVLVFTDEAEIIDEFFIINKN